MTRGRGGAIAVAVCAFLFSSSVAQGAPGDLDPTYGEHGIAELPYLNQPQAYFRDGSIDPAGRFVGLFTNGSTERGSCDSEGCIQQWQWGLTRLSPSGSVDKSFGAQGTILFPTQKYFGYSPLEYLRIGLQSDGGMLGDFLGQGNERILPDGTVDWQTPEQRDEVLAVLPDDSFLTSAGEFSLEKRTANGALDPSFGEGGRVTTEVGSYSFATDLVLTDAGKIWVVGDTSSGGNDAVAVVRYKSDGSLDPSFSGDGIATFDLGHPEWSPLAAQATVDSSGRLIVGGEANADPTNGCCEGFTMAVTPDGQLDSAYGDGGFVLGASPVGLGYPTEMVALDDNRVLMLQGGLWVADGTGHLDKSFGGSDSMVQLPAFIPYGVTPASGGTVLAYGSTPYQEGIAPQQVQAATARILVRPGPPDADADGVLDRDDSCPDSPASTMDGCGTVKRSIEVRFRSHPRRLHGSVRSVDPSYAECPEQTIRIRRKFRGRTKVVATAPVSTPGSLDVPIGHKRGHYVAILRDQVTGSSGHCLPARSEPVRLRPVASKSS